MKFVDIGSPVKSGSLVEAPGFELGGEWVNSDQLVLSEVLADPGTKAVLVDFWTYSCINCQRTIPYLRSWWDKYEDKGLVIVGVHTPEFEFEKEHGNVVDATQKYGVGWPVVQDNDYGIWKRYRNNYWPRKYLVNKEGKIVYDHIGEGGYEETERRIQELLGVSMEVTDEGSRSIKFGMRQTPELYINARGKASGHLGKGEGKVELVGEWSVREDYSEAGAGASLKLRFQAASVNLVMSLPGDDTGSVRVSVDEENESKVEVFGDDLYRLWEGEFGEHDLVMEFDEGMRVHAFTFGS